MSRDTLDFLAELLDFLAELLAELLVFVVVGLFTYAVTCGGQ